MTRRMDLREKFWSKVDKNGPVVVESLGPCWKWNAARSKQGYGHLVTSQYDHIKREQLAHRVSWIIHYGSIPDRLNVLHRCDNPECTNPSHLFVGTKADNSRDAVSKGRTARGKRNARGLFEKEQVIAMRNARNEGLTYRQIAERFNTKLNTVDS